MGQLDYINVLKALREIPFPVGKKLLTDFLRGKGEQESIRRNRLHNYTSFGALAGYDGHEVTAIIENLAINNCIEQVQLHSFMKGYKVTSKGMQELAEPVLYKKKMNGWHAYQEPPLTEQDKKLFEAFGFFLGQYNEPQKKAITGSAQTILCVAGAGSGKTTTLTKRIEFLIRFRSVAPGDILAITFTRKARQEMQQRLAQAGVSGIYVETFNSFCERMLVKYADLAYGRIMRVLTFRDKVRLMESALAHIRKTAEECIMLYYTAAQQRGKEPQELFYGFMNDCFSIIEHYKCERNDLDDFSGRMGLGQHERAGAKMVYNICRFILDTVEKEGLRDYTDQLLDTLHLFAEHPDVVPQFKHVLVDEYQDINALQDKLLGVLKPANIFCVGDPRQSIFGWRGSHLRYILDFQEKYPQGEVITLRKNYRSCGEIVQLINSCISGMRLPELEHAREAKGSVVLVECDDEAGEHKYVIKAIESSTTARQDIFVLARTNRQLQELHEQMKLRGIRHVVRSDEHNELAGEGEVTLSTTHAIKGMEASLVFVVGCSSMYFPCRAGDHPIVDMVKELDYDREDEERRLFYVALSRAKDAVHMTYSGSLTWFVTPEMKKMLSSGMQPDVAEAGDTRKGDSYGRLRQWRKELARAQGIPPYFIFSDDTLMHIAIRRPENLDELAEVKGVGVVKLQKYGNEILGIVGF